MFREVRVFEIREVLRLWLRGEGLRSVGELVSMDRKTVRRYVDAAVSAGVDRAGGDDQLNDRLLAVVCERVRPSRPTAHGVAWELLEANRAQLAAWLVDDGLTVVKAGELLARQGVAVPERTLHRWAAGELGVGRGARRPTVPVADGEPGSELQVDFGRMGLIDDPDSGRRRVVHALIFTACYSRHCFVWLSYSQTTAAVIAGCEAAWGFFAGVFKVLIPDNLTPVVVKANPLEPRFNQAFIEYAQARGFIVDPARVRAPQDKGRVERTVPFVRNSFFAGERFIDLADAQARAGAWCRGRAGMRVHGTHQARPAELFALEEHAALLPVPAAVYDVPVYATAKVARDHHIEVAKALYSVPGDLIGNLVDVRADRSLVRVAHRGAVIKVHPRQPPGGRSTDACDLPSERTVYALRDLDRLIAMAAAHGPAVGVYAAGLLDHPLPWTKMRQVYALLGLVKRWGPGPVNEACARAADAEAFNANLIGRMLERGGDAEPTGLAVAPAAGPARFARPDRHFATQKPSKQAGSSSQDDAAGGVA